MRKQTYEDIIHLPHPISKKHPPMPLYDRAAQFSPFAALTGHDAALKETARLTDEKHELSEETMEALSEQIRMLKENPASEEVTTFTYFVPDHRKQGGAYITRSGVVRKINEYEHTIILTDRTAIPIEQIMEIKGKMFGDSM